MKVLFKKEKETKNTIRYKEVDAKGKDVEPEDASIGTLYLKKKIAADREEITVEIT